MLDKIYHTLFLSTPSARRATRCPLCERLRDLRFLSTPSARRATLFRVLGGKPYQNFYPRPPRGGRPRRICNTAGARSFLSTPSARRATATPPIPENSFEFLSTPSARRATSNGLHSKIHHKISIHALREEGDHRHKQAAEDLHHFYPRPPRGGRLHAVFCPRLLVAISIHALREEGDSRRTSSRSAFDYFYPRPPRGGRPAALSPSGRPQRYFYPRPPRGGRRRRRQRFPDPVAISIHALREEGDHYARYVGTDGTLFLSTPSARRATAAVSSTTRAAAFLSTPSARRATLRQAFQVQRYYISIHALREEGDSYALLLCLRVPYFYPRPPRGGRRFQAITRQKGMK